MTAMPFQEPKRRLTCRVCDQSALTDVLELGSVALPEFGRRTEHPVGPTSPLTLALCDPTKGGCTFVQLRQEALSRDYLYREYWYRSGINESMRAELARITALAQSHCVIEPGDVVLDIGANDGSLLATYHPRCRRVAFEPAVNLSEYYSSTNITLVPDFFSSRRYFETISRPAMVITSIAMFYDLDDPIEFTHQIRQVLHPDGVWILQLSYLASMLKTLGIDNVCHEHVGYYSLSVLDRIMTSCGLVVVDADVNRVNGGSICLVVKHARHRPKRTGRVDGLLAEERNRGLGLAATYFEFARAVDDLGSLLRGYLSSVHSPVHGYAASTKGITLLTALGITAEYISAISDRDPRKWGTVFPGTLIPIISEEDSRRSSPSHYLVLPGGFRGSFLRRESDYLASGGRMIFPCPTPTCVGVENGVEVVNSLSAVMAESFVAGRLDRP